MNKGTRLVHGTQSNLNEAHLLVTEHGGVFDGDNQLVCLAEVGSAEGEVVRPLRRQRVVDLACLELVPRIQRYLVQQGNTTAVSTH